MIIAYNVLDLYLYGYRSCHKGIRNDGFVQSAEPEDTDLLPSVFMVEEAPKKSWAERRLQGPTVSAVAFSRFAVFVFFRKLACTSKREQTPSAHQSTTIYLPVCL